MKRLRSFLLTLGLCLCALEPIYAIEDDAVQLSSLDSVRVSLLTCQPRQEIYALYGHSAIRIEDMKSHTDLVVNYGIFSFQKSLFALHFMFGLTDYMMSIDDFESFAYHYASVGSGIRQQELNLTPTEKERLIRALDENYRPENRIYRYNYYYDNCTTRARDMIERCLDGKIDYRSSSKDMTYRDAIHHYNEQHPWARCGKDMLLGIGSDHIIGFRELQFLPENTMKDFERAVVIDSMGNTRSIVKSSSWAVMPGVQVTEKEFPLRPSSCAWIVFACLMAVTAFDVRRRKCSWPIDSLLMTVCAVCGLILFCMIFSQHPTVRVNFQILLFNPLLIVGGWKMLKSLRQQSTSRLMLTYIACLILFLILGFWQHYAEGAFVIGVALLLRYAAIEYVFLRQKR